MSFAFWCICLMMCHCVVILVCYPTSWLHLPVPFKNVIQAQDTMFVLSVCLKLWADQCIPMYTHCCVLMNAVGIPDECDASVWHFVSNHKVMTALFFYVAFKVLLWSFLTNPIDMYFLFGFWVDMILLMLMLKRFSWLFHRAFAYIQHSSECS
jgi:hypothetical protein